MQLWGKWGECVASCVSDGGYYREQFLWRGTSSVGRHGVDILVMLSAMVLCGEARGLMTSDTYLVLLGRFGLLKFTTHRSTGR